MAPVRAVTVVVLAGAWVGVAAADARVEAAPGSHGTKPRAAALVRRAEHRVTSRHASCVYHTPRGHLQLGDGGAGPLVRSVLGVFRRPATAEEQALAVGDVTDREDPSFGEATIPRDGVRVVRQGNREVVLTALRDVPPPGPDRAAYDRCTSLIAQEIGRLASTVEPAVLARARRVVRVVRRNGRPAAHPPRTEGVTFSETSGHGDLVTQSGLGAFDPALFRRTGTAGGSSAPGGGARWMFIIPDGVATIDATFRRRISTGPGRPSKPTSGSVRQTLSVHDNVAFTTIRPGGGFPSMVWRAADGSVVRRLPGA